MAGAHGQRAPEGSGCSKVRRRSGCGALFCGMRRVRRRLSPAVKTCAETALHHTPSPPEYGEDEEQDEHERGLGIHRKIGKEGAFRRVEARRRHAREGVKDEPCKEDRQNGGDVPRDLFGRAEQRPDQLPERKEQHAAK